MSPSTSTSGPSASHPGRTETSRFRCACGRSVAAQRGSEAATTGLCSSCRSRRSAETPLHRT